MNMNSPVDPSRFQEQAPPLRAGVSPRHVGYDLTALTEFAYQVLCAAAAPEMNPARLRASAINPARLSAQQLQVTERKARSSIPLAYEIWLSYLFELEALLHYVHLQARELTAVERQGLEALSRARARFLRTHRFCPHCEAANPRVAKHCAHCHKEL